MILNHNGLSSVRGVIARDRFVLSPVGNFFATAPKGERAGRTRDQSSEPRHQAPQPTSRL
jgi:hypothetical protein